MEKKDVEVFEQAIQLISALELDCLIDNLSFAFDISFRLGFRGEVPVRNGGTVEYEFVTKTFARRPRARLT